MTPPLCACGCGGALKVARYPSQQSTWVRGHSPSFQLSQAVIERRFWAQVNKTAGCWLWTGEASAHFGYGRLHVRKKRVRAHRFAWTLLNGPIPHGQHVLHGCDNPLCVRPHPDHLHLGTQAENMAEMHRRFRDRHSIARRGAA